MQANKKIMLLLIPSLLISLLSGCPVPEEPIKVILTPNSAEIAQSSSVKKRFQESAAKAPTLVESAIELSGKYAKLAEQSAMLQRKSQELISENAHLKDQVAELADQLQQTQKELTEANDFLIEMRIELNNWKTDVLGFRGQMRDAEKAQLEALLKILKILGGEVKAESATDGQASSTAVPPGQPTPQLQSRHAGTTLGESNE